MHMYVCIYTHIYIYRNAIIIILVQMYFCMFVCMYVYVCLSNADSYLCIYLYI